MPYQLTPMPPRRDNQDFLTSFMSTFLPAAQQMLMYKYQKSMEEDSWQKRQRMEQAWKLEQMKAEHALAKDDPVKQKELEKQILELQKTSLEVDKLKKEAEWREKNPQAFESRMRNQYNFTAPERLEEATGTIGLNALGATGALTAPQPLPVPSVLGAGQQPQTIPNTMGPRIRQMFGLPAEKPAAPDDTLTRLVGRAAVSKATGVPSEQLEAVPQFAPTAGEIENKKRISLAKTGDEITALELKETAKRDIEIKGAIKDRMGLGESEPVARANVMAQRASQSDTPEMKAVSKALADRAAQVQVLVKDGMSAPEAEALVVKANKEKYLKDLPESIPQDVRDKLGLIAASGIPIPPPPGMGIGASGLPERIAFYKAFIKGVDDLGGPEAYALKRMDFRTNGSILLKQTGRLKSMEAFVKNIDKQVARVTSKDVMGALSRVDTKLINQPLRWWKTHVPGSADEAILAMYAKEISAEIQRLSAGNAESIATLPEGNRMEWEKVHDLSLPLGDLAKVFKETSHAGHMRYDTLHDVVQSVRDDVYGGGEKMPKPTWDEMVNPQSTTAPAGTPRKVGRFTVEVE